MFYKNGIKKLHIKYKSGKVKNNDYSGYKNRNSKNKWDWNNDNG